MTVLQTIYDSDMINKPLFIEDFVSENVKYDSAKTMLSNLVRSGDLKRYAQGIYYVPKKTIIGESVISFESVIERKYIFDNDDIFGYYSGIRLLNDVGLTTQVPNIPEITTNKEATRKRSVRIGKRSVIVRKSETEVNNDNVLYLQFFDIFRYADTETIRENRAKVIAFFDRNRLNFDMLRQTEKKVSMKLRKAIRRSGIYDELACR
ncbi:MAG: hypothetical protein IKX74_03085 [Erysipelotrichaceae bacterium]|nr:hypothetical protein [Erysipelotrichaceae bacterium]MBR5048611.1 hypothetical protein [Erysipelotrichaceae bacterium]